MDYDKCMEEFIEYCQYHWYGNSRFTPAIDYNSRRTMGCAQFMRTRRFDLREDRGFQKYEPWERVPRSKWNWIHFSARKDQPKMRVAVLDDEFCQAENGYWWWSRSNVDRRLELHRELEQELFLDDCIRENLRIGHSLVMPYARSRKMLRHELAGLRAREMRHLKPYQRVDSDGETYCDAQDVSYSGDAQAQEQEEFFDCVEEPEDTPHEKDQRKEQRHRSRNGRVTYKWKEARRNAIVCKKMFGKAQALFGCDFTWPANTRVTTEHILRLPMIEELIAKLSSAPGEVNWPSVISELVFFFSHLSTGGFTKANIVISFAHLVKNLPLRNIAFDVERLFARADNAEAANLSGVGVAIAGVLSLCFALLFSKLPNTRDVDSFIMRFSRVGAMISSVEKIADIAERGSELILSFIKKLLFGYDDAEMDEMKGVNKFCDEVQKLNFPGVENTLEEGSANRGKVISLLDRADNIQKMLDARRVPLWQCERFRKCAIFVAQLRAAASAAGSGALRSRIPPMVVHFIGDTAVGKTNMLDYLNSNLLVAMGHHDPQDLVNKVYYRYPQNQWYDGYQNGTEILVCDDFGAIKDSISNPTPEGLEVLRHTNPAPFRPPMADLSGKANAVFEASVVIWTSNRPTFNFESMTNPEAVYSRVHLRYKQYVKPEFSLPRNLYGRMCNSLDVKKVQATLADNPNAFRDCMLFDRLSLEGTEWVVLEQGLSFDEMTAQCVTLLREKRNIGTQVLDDRRAYFEQLVNMVGNAQVDEEDIVILEEEAIANRLVDYDTPTVFTRNWGWPLGDGRKHIDVYRTVAGRLANMPREELRTVMQLADRAHTQFADAIATPCLEIDEDVLEDSVTMLTRCFGALSNGVVANEYCRFTRLIQEGKIRPCTNPLHTCTNSRDLLKVVMRVTQRRLGDFCLFLSRGPDLNGHPIYDFIKIVGWGALLSTIMSLLTQFVFKFILKMTGGDPKRRKGRDMYGATDAVYVDHKGHINFTLKGDESPEVMKFLCHRRDIGDITLEVQIDGILHKWTGQPDTYAADVGSMRGGVAEQYSTDAKAKAGKVEQYATDAKAKAGKVEELPPNVKERSGGTEQYSSGSVKAISGRVESTTDQNAIDIRNKVARNIYGIFTGPSSDSLIRVGSGVIVTGRILLTNRHIHAVLREYVELRSPYGLVYKLLKEDLQAYSIPDDHETMGKRDLAVMELPRQFPIHSSLCDYVMTTADFATHTNLAKASLLGCDSVNGKLVLRVYDTDTVTAFHREEFELRSRGETTMIREFYGHCAETMPGDCGSVMIAFDTGVQRKICGIHMAGFDGQGYTGMAVAIHQGVIDQLLAGLTPKLRYSHSLTCGAVEGIAMGGEAHVQDGVLVLDQPVPEGFIYLGKMDKPVYANSKTSIRRSPVASICGPIKKKPAFLRPFTIGGETINPMEKAMVKACGPNMRVHPQFLKEASFDVKQMINSRFLPSDCRVLTFEQAIAGIEGDECYPPINRSTSPGYGWDKAGKGKTRWLGDGQEYRYDHPELLAAYQAGLERLRDGKRLGKFWTDTLKDELRPIEKVDAGKTRLFSAGEMVQTIFLRQYFDGFAAHMMRNHTEVESCVGLNVYSLEWDRLVRRLSSKGKHVVAGDFTNYDGSLPAEVIWETLEVVKEFYSQVSHDPEEDKIRELLWLEIVNSVHINGNIVYAWTHGQPSGCPFTSLLNSVVHSIIVRVVYLLCAEKYAKEHCNLLDFNKFVKHNNYGDDDVTNISPQIIGWFNQETQAEMYATFGMTYTDEAKTGELVRSRSIDEVAFLKRKFRWDGEQARYRAPLEIDTILEMPCWNKTRTEGPYALTALVLQDAVYELCHHDVDTWNKHFQTFDQARRAIYLEAPCAFLSYDTMNRIEAEKYCSGDKLPQNPVIGASTYSPQESKQQILLGCLSGSGQSAEGEVFTSSDTCVPSQNNRLRIRRAASSRLSGPTGEEHSLANQLEQLVLTDTQSNFKGLSNQLLLVTKAYIECMEKRVAPWSPKQDMIDNATRSLQRAENAIRTLMTAPGEKSYYNRDVEAAQAVAYADMVDELPPIDFGPDCDCFEMTGEAQSGMEQPTDLVNFAGEEGEHTKQQEVMKLVEDGQVAEEDRAISKAVPKAMQCGAEDPLRNDIVGFLSRPVQMASFDWTKAQGRGHSLFTANFPHDWLKFPMIQEKLRGFRFLRCTFVVEIQVNAQPFNAGALMAWFEPLKQQLKTSPSSVTHTAGKMGYPYVIYRCGEATAVRIKIPFFPVISHYDLIYAYGNAGQLVIEVLSALTGADDVDGTVWAWAENIDINMPTGAPSPAALTGAAQAGMLERTAESLDEMVKSLPGTDLLSPPLLDTFDKAMKLISSAGALTTAFGWSKPTNPDKTGNMQPAHARFSQNSMGTSDARVMGLDTRNTTSIPTDVFNTKEDEMAFSTIIKRPVFLKNFTMSKTDRQGARLEFIPADPCYCMRHELKESDSDKKFLRRSETYLSYLSTCATYWRGGLRYRFMFIKTPFHSGRLRFTFVPGNTFDPNQIDFSKCYSEVHDLRGRMDVEFTVPYSFNQPWRPTEFNGVAEAAPDQGHFTLIPQGWILVTVVNALRAPSTVADSIEVLVMISAGDDFQFAIPYVNPSVHPVLLSGSAQAGIYEDCGDQGIKRTAVVNVEGVGEVFTGFRQWLRRMTARPVAGKNTPFTCLDQTETSSGQILGRTETPWARAIVLYRFYSGSMRWLVGSDREGAYKTHEIALRPPLVKASVGETRASGTAVTFIPPADQPTELQFPFYQLWPAMPTEVGQPEQSYVYDTVTNTGNFSALPYNEGVMVEDVSASPTDALGYFHSIGEDFSFGYLIGPPITFMAYRG